MPALHRLEERLIVRAVTRETQRRQEDLRALLHSNPDLVRLLEIASAHGVDGLLSMALGPLLPARSDPRSPIGALKFRADLIGAANRARLEELDGILEKLTTRSIPVLTLKGPIAALAYHGDVRARRFGDLDLLVEMSRVDDALEALAELGFDRVLVEPHRVEFARHHFHALELQKRDTWLTLELHFRFGPRYFDLPLDARAVFERARTFDAPSGSYPVLAVEDALIFLAAHGAKHAWSRLLWVADLDRFSVSQTVDWPTLMRRSEEVGAARIVRTALALTRQVLGTRWDPAAEAWVRSDPRAEGLAQEARALVFERDVEPGPLESQWFRTRSRDRARTALADWIWFAREVIEPTEAERRLLPAGRLQNLTYAVRPFNVLRRYLER